MKTYTVANVREMPKENFVIIIVFDFCDISAVFHSARGPLLRASYASNWTQSTLAIPYPADNLLVRLANRLQVALIIIDGQENMPDDLNTRAAFVV